MTCLVPVQCRDTYIAFGLVSGTYMFIGVTFYLTFPLAKSCIEDVSPVVMLLVVVSIGVGFIIERPLVRFL